MNEEIWKSTLDHRYEVVVTRVAPYQGQLTITDAGRKISNDPMHSDTTR